MTPSKEEIKKLGFHYDPNIPYPLQTIDYLKGSDWLYNNAISSLKKENGNEFGILIDYFERVYMPLRLEMGDKEFYSAVRTSALDTQISYEWSKYKQVYKFNPELYHLLTEETDSDSVMADMFLTKLPFPCFYVDNKITDNEGNEYVGFYVIVRNDLHEDKQMLIQFCQTDYERSFRFCSLPLNKGENKTIDELISKKYPLAGYIEKDIPEKDVFVEMCKKAINCIAYLCTDKVDVVKRKLEIKRKDQSASKKKPRKVNVGLIGDKVARTIRENRVRYIYEGNEDKPHTKGSPKSAHIRRAHYHSYWTGKRSEPDKREMIVKLIDPILVKGEADKVTIRKVSENKKG